MKPATVRQIKQELKHKDESELLNICVRLANYKKDNKELLSYLLFESDDEQGYAALIKQEISNMFLDINQNTNYWVKKGLRKIIRYMDRVLRYTKSMETQIDVRLHFCEVMLAEGFSAESALVFGKILEVQFNKVSKVYEKLHEDIKYDFESRLSNLAS